MISRVDHAELLILGNRVNTLKDAEKVKPPREPYQPSPRVIQVSDFHRKAAAKLNTCPHELEAILQHAILTDNVMVQKAFKDFVMKAKLSLDEDELPLDSVRNKLKDCEIQNDQAKSQYEQELLNYNATLVRIQQDVDTAKDAVTQQWRDILGHLRTQLVRHKNPEAMRVWDRCALRGIMFFYKEDRRDSDAAPKCPLGKYKDTIRCSDAGWEQLAQLPAKQIPDVISCIRSEYDGWKREYLDKHVLTEDERKFIFKSAAQGIRHMLKEYQHYGEPVDYEPKFIVPADLYAKYDLWLKAEQAVGVDGADGVTPNEVRQYINSYVNQAVFHWEMVVIKEQEQRNYIEEEWGSSTAPKRRRRIRVNTSATSSTNGGIWVLDEDGQQVFVQGW